MRYAFDSYGNYYGQTASTERSTTVAPPTCGPAPLVGTNWPNWNGTAWLMVPYIAPPAVEPLPKQWDAFTFYGKFTDAEWVAAMTLAKTDVTAQYFVNTLQAAISSGTPIYANDPRTVSGLAYLSANPASSPVLAAGRSAIILS